MWKIKRTQKINRSRFEASDTVSEDDKTAKTTLAYCQLPTRNTVQLLPIIEVHQK